MKNKKSKFEHFAQLVVNELRYTHAFNEKEIDKALLACDKGNKKHRLVTVQQPPTVIAFNTEQQAKGFIRALEKFGQAEGTPVEWAMGKVEEKKPKTKRKARGAK